jgi:DNA-binding MarR family transcriptional regulator
MPELNDLVHQTVRLRIMAALVSLEAGRQLDFSVLRELLGTTDGNLGAHLRKLEEAGYVGITKTFFQRKPRTLLQTTDLGRSAFLDHVRALEEVIRGPALGVSRSPDVGPER